MRELEQSGPELVRALHRVLNAGSRCKPRATRPANRRRENAQ
jgi:hypothetical protein